MLAVAEFDPNTIIVAIIGLGGVGLSAHMTMRRVKQVSEQVTTPNGVPTSHIVYDAWKRVQAVEEQIVELKHGQKGIQSWAGAHHDENQEKLRAIEAKFDSHDGRDDRAFVWLGVPRTILDDDAQGTEGT